MKKRSIIKFALGAAALMLMLSGCQGNAASNETSTQSENFTIEMSSPKPITLPETSEEVAVSETPTEVTDETEKETLNVTVLKGPTGLGTLKLMQENEDKTALNNYNFNIAGSPDEIVAKIATGEIDVAAVPSNLASVLYNKTEGKVKVLAVNTLGVLYLLENGNEIESFSDLKGKTVEMTGKASTPEYTLNYLLSKNGLEVGKDVTVEFKAEHSELAALMAEGSSKLAVLPEPFVTTTITKNPDVRIALDLNAEWEAIEGESLITGVIIARSEVVEGKKEAVDSFLDEYKKSIEFANSNVDETAKLSAKFDIVPEAVAKKAIPRCNIVFLDGDEMKSTISSYLNVLFAADPKSVGGKLPNEDFYYKK